MSFTPSRSGGRIVFKPLNPSSNPVIVSTSPSLAESYSVFSTNIVSLSLNNVAVTASAADLNKTIVTPGTSTSEKIIVLDSNKNISGLNTLSCNTITVNGVQLGGTSNSVANLYLSSITPGTGTANRALVLDSNLNASNINTLSTNELKIQTDNLEIPDNDISTFTINSIEYNNNWVSMCWSDTLNLFIAIANTGTNNRIMTSPNGITWTLQTSPADYNWTSIAWSKKLSLLVATASSGTGNRVMTSTNGINWTLRTSPVDNNWSSVCWSESLNLFVSIANTGTNNRIMTSSNGTLWSSRTSPLFKPGSQVISAGVDNFLYVTNNSIISGCGANTTSLLSDGTTTRRLTPVNVASNINSVISIVMGNTHALALLNNGTVIGWSDNSSGQLGNGTTVDSTTPVLATNVINAIQIDAGSASSYALLADGRIMSWGTNTSGQLGNGNTTQQNSPVLVSNMSNAVKITCGSFHGLALLTDGTIKSWGLNTSGQLGDATTVNKTSPVTVVGINNAIQISAGQDFSVALLSNGEIRAWGSNNNGQLGDGSTTVRISPVNGPVISNVIDIKCGYWSTYALINDGTIKSWGWNNVGQLGNNTTINSTSAINVSNISNAVSISKGRSITAYAILADGTIRGWGRNSNGQLGINNTTDSLTPINVITSAGDSTPINNIRLETNINWNSVCFSPELSLFVAVGNGEYINSIMTSSNGIDWSIRQAVSYCNWQSICWAPELRLFIAVGSSELNRVMTSPDGINWTIGTIILNNWTQVVWSSEKKIAIAICNNYSNSELATSKDGINWRPIQLQQQNPLSCICWSNTLQKFAILSKIENKLRLFNSWSLSPSTGSATACRSVYWISALSMYIILGNNKLLTSTNGTTWTNRTVPNLWWNNLAYSSSLNLLVAVGDGATGATTSCIITSPDGVTWTTRTAPAARNYYTITWSSTLSLFVAVNQTATSGSGTSTSGIVITSSNGTSWTSRSAQDLEWWQVIWNSSLNLFICVGSGNSSATSNRIMTSTDGTTWIYRLPQVISSWKSIAFSSTLNLFVAIADNPSNLNYQQIVVSTNAINWINVYNQFNGTWRNVIWVNELEIFIAVGEHTNANYLIYSSDGYNWNSIYINNQSLRGIAWSSSLQNFVAVANTASNNNIITSSASSGSNTNINSLLTTSTSKNYNLSHINKQIYVPFDISKYYLNVWNFYNMGSLTNNGIAFGNNTFGIITTAGIYWSSDGLTWTVSSLSTGIFNCITYSEELNLFVAISTTAIRTANQAHSWITNTILSINNNWTSVCWSADLMQFVAVSNSNNFALAMHSNDGVTWFNHNTPNSAWSSVCWSPYLQLYVAVASSGTLRIMTSSDGISWNGLTAPANNSWSSVCWGQECGRFVAVASSGSNRVMTSTDGINWSLVTVPTNSWTSVIYVSELRLFIAIASSGSNRLIYSKNGTNWDSIILNVNNSWSGICWSPSLANLVICSTDGTNRVGMSQCFKTTNMNTVTNTNFMFNNNLVGFNSALLPSTHQLEIGLNSPQMSFLANNNNTANTTMTLNTSNIFELNTNNASINISDHNGTNSGLALNNSLITATAAQINSLAGLTAGVGSASKPLLLNSINDISNINQISVSSLTLNSVFSGLSLGVGAANTPLILDANKNMIGINNLSANNLKIKNTTLNTYNKQISSNSLFNTTFIKAAQINNNNSSSISNACWSPQLAMFVAGANSVVSNNSISISYDGYNWLPYTITGGPVITSVCWSPELSMFVATSNNNTFYYSTNGTSWTPVTVSLNYTWTNIIWVSQLSLFIAISYSNSNILTSSNGLTWNTVNIGFSFLNQIIYANSTLIILAENRIITSSDGSSWASPNTLPSGLTYKSIAYSSTLNLYVIVASIVNSTANATSKIITSSDLTNWTNSSYITSLNNNWQHIIWIAELSIFISVSTNPSTFSNNSNIIISNDGINWHSRTNLTHNQTFTFIVWSPQLSKIVLFTNSRQIFVSNSGNTSRYSDYNYQNTENKLNTIINKQNKPSGFINKIVNNWINRETVAHNSIRENTYSFNSIACGREHAFVLLNNGTIMAWGDNSNGQLGNGNTTNSLTPVQVSGITTATKIVSNAWSGAALLQNKTVMAWGNNQLGLLGIGSAGGNIVTPTLVKSDASGTVLTNVIDISMGSNHTMFLLSDGTVHVCGGGTSSSYEITRRDNPSTLIYDTNQNYTNKILNMGTSTGTAVYLDNIAIIGSMTGSCATLTNNGNVYVWGNTSGTLYTTPTLIYSMYDAIYLGVSASSVHIITTTNQIKSWGSNFFGNLGNGTTTDSISSFVTTSNISNAVRISSCSFGGSVAAILSDGTVSVWGKNNQGLLGLGTTTNVLTPTTLTGFNNSLAITFGDQFSMLINSNQNLITHGRNNKGQLGNNTTTNSLTAVNVWTNSGNSDPISNLYLNTLPLYYKNNWTSICRSDELDLFVAISSSGTNTRVMTSSNGITWTSRTSPADNNWTSICWSKELSLFVAVASSGTDNRVMTSSNGINWTSRTSSADNNWTSVCWSKELTLFVAVASSGTGNRVMTSPDGINWTSRTSSADNNWTAICWAPELTLFVTVASSGSGNRIMTSPDGINWTSRTSPANNNWTSICWANNINKFIAVSETGSSNRVMISENGINWTLQYFIENLNWKQVIWINELNYAVAISNNGNKRLMISKNGIEWYIENLTINNAWTGIAWSSDLAILCAISNSNNNNQNAHTIMAYPTSKNALIAYPNQLIVSHTDSNRGRIGLGMTPSFQLQLSNDSAFKLSTTTWTISSDSRLKENIEEANLDDCYNKIKTLPLKRYRWKDEIYNNTQIDDRTKLGWIADDVEQVIPQAVKIIDAYGLSDCKSLNNDQIITNLFGCLKKLNINLNAKKNLIDQLETKYNTLNDLVQNLEIVEE